MLQASWEFSELQGDDGDMRLWGPVACEFVSVLQGDDGDVRLWGAIACEFVSALSVQWTEQVRTCVARCRSVSTAHMGRVGDATGCGAHGTRESFVWESSSRVHGAAEDWLRLGVRGTEDADVSPGAILIGTAFVGGVVVAANGLILQRACLTFDWRGRGREGWVAGQSGWGLLWWRAHV